MKLSKPVQFFIVFAAFLALGMPLMIMMASDDVKLAPCEGAKKYIILRSEKLRRLIPFIHTAVMAAISVMVLVFRISPEGNIAVGVLSALGLCGTVALLV